MTEIVPKPGFRVTGWHVLAGVTLFFAIVIGVDAWFITKAYDSFSGQIVDNPYEAGLAFNQRLRDQQHQVELGWQVDAGFEPSGDVLVRVVDRAGAPVGGLAGTVRFERPATERGARTFPLRETAPGQYRAEAPPVDGAWDLTARLKGPAGVFEAQRRIVSR